MSRIQVEFIEGFRCDKPGCPATFQQPRGNFFKDRDKQDKAAARADWMCWVGRSQRHYCPSHGPSNPGKMRRVW